MISFLSLNATGNFQNQTAAIAKASYEVTYEITRYMIGETLVKPRLLTCTKQVLEDSASQKMMQISMANDTIRSRIEEPAGHMKRRLIPKIRKSLCNQSE